MATRIYWTPPTTSNYHEVYSAPLNTSPLTIATIVNDQRPGPFWEESTGRFFFDDAQGDDKTVYRVKSFDQSGLLWDSGIFQPDASFAANLNTRTRVDHNYGFANALQAVAPNGQPIANVIIRCFRKPDYDAGRTDIALHITETTAEGRWVSPFWLEPGMDYVLVFEKAGSFRQTVQEINVT